MNIQTLYADKTYSLGDITGDSIVNAVDASCVLAEYSILSTDGKYTFTDEQISAADINKDNRIDANDASEILAYYSYLSTGGKILDMQEYLNYMHPPKPPQSTTSTTSVTTVNTTTSSATQTSETKISSNSGTTSTTTNGTISNTTESATTTSSSTTATTTNPDKVSEIRISQTELNLNVGNGALAANVTMLPSTAKNKSEIWTSSDENIAIVDDEGWVFGKSAITSICADTAGLAALFTVIVQVPAFLPNTHPSLSTTAIFSSELVHISDLSLAVAATTTTANSTIKVNEIKAKENDIKMTIGEYKIAYITMLPENATNKNEIWKSSDESIAVVDSQGGITALKEGVCIITVKSEDNPDVKADINVTVTNSNKVTEIHLSKYEMTVGIGYKDLSWVTMLPSNFPDAFLGNGV